MPKVKVVLPQKQALLDAMSVAETSIEAAKYLEKLFRSILTKANLVEKYADLLKKVEEWAQHVEFKLLSTAQPWFGQPVQPDFLNSKIQMAQKAAQELKEMKTALDEDITFHFGISDDSEFRRGYAAGTKSVDAKLVTALDSIYMAWLAENNLGTEKGIVYKTDAKGNFQMNGNEKIKADPEAVKNLIADPEKGLTKFAQAREIELKCVQHAYLTPKAEAQAKAEAQKAVEKIAVQESTNEPTNKPTSGMAGGR